MAGLPLEVTGSSFRASRFAVDEVLHTVTAFSTARGASSPYTYYVYYYYYYVYYYYNNNNYYYCY